MPIHDDIAQYNTRQTEENRAICQLLATEITKGLPKATNKLWHGGPVWFLDDNPVAGYAVLKASVQLLFWSGQSFDEPGLKPEGTFKAAEARYTEVGQIDTAALQTWLAKAQAIQWDYKNIVKRRGQLVRLEPSDG
ncbi:MAG TPA: DUF1801 domain-containing protein [Candidatus Saccharimonadales bacterium]|nr:DUF1801 domain-containing protein [Candidatus Saccharimonadales bacterium]